MIFYKKRRQYKYILHSDYHFESGIVILEKIDTKYLELTPDGVLTIRKGYAWDGPSGPAIDTHNFMRPSLIHDALYQLLRDSLLDQQLRLKADQILREQCLISGMSPARAWLVYQGVRLGGASSARPDLLSAR